MELQGEKNAFQYTPLFVIFLGLNIKPAVLTQNSLPQLSAELGKHCSKQKYIGIAEKTQKTG